MTNIKQPQGGERIDEKCKHQGDKNIYSPQFCQKCGKEFAYVHPIFIK